MNNATSKPLTVHWMRLYDGSNGKYFECIPLREYSSFVYGVIAVISVISVTAFSTNLVIIYTIGRTHSLRTPSNTLILNLAVSDLLGGLLCQPIFCAFKFSEMTCGPELYLLTRKLYESVIWFLSPMSLMLVVTIIADRFLAIRLHLRYQEFVTAQRYAITLAIVWIVSFVFGVCKTLYYYNFNLHVIAIVYIACLIFLALYFLFAIFRVIRRHSVQIQAQQQSVQQYIDMPRYKKSVNTMYYVMGAFVLCYLPIVGALTAHAILRKITLQLVFSYTISEILLMLNGVVNPIIYCWRIHEIRNAVKRLLCEICARS